MESNWKPTFHSPYTIDGDEYELASILIERDGVFRARTKGADTNHLWVCAYSIINASEALMRLLEKLGR